MIKTAVRIDEQLQVAKSKEGKYLTFLFQGNGHNNNMEMEVVGWTEFEVLSNKSENINGIVRLWGYEISVARPKILPGRNTAEITDTACIVIFEYSKPCKHYLGTVVDAILNVMSIAEKDPETLVIIETEIVDELGGEQVQYNIIEKGNYSV